MTEDEFKALKVGDRVFNPVNSASGTVSEKLSLSASIKWDGIGGTKSGGQAAFTYNQASDAWHPWVKQ